MPNYDMREVLSAIDPGRLGYQEWVNVGMALKDAGLTAEDWEAWSARDADRYHRGECAKKWAGFNGCANPVTSGTLVAYAREQGWSPPREEGHELSWDSVIGGKKDDLAVVDPNWVEAQEIAEPADWHPARELTRYLELLFEAGDTVGYVTQTWAKTDEKTGETRYLPTKGSYDRTAGELIASLNACGGDIGAVLGDYKPEAGAWIRFNPLDGRGVKNENVAEYRYALVESDDMDIGRQYAIIQEMELPVAVMVHSGKKSLHAIVHIDAADYDEYRKRVDYLYDACRKNGLKIDSQNRNPSRLSRMPGVTRMGRKQFIVSEAMGKESYAQWREWIEGVNDDLPEPENIADAFDDLPELSPPLIDGVLRQGHKMLLAGPSKAGKSFALIQLCIAIAEGGKWLTWQCAQGRVMYVNLELDRATCLHRFKDVYAAMGLNPDHAFAIDVWNLRGKAIPMDKLAPKLIRRASKKKYIAIIIDPIYKVITGDENSADQMANFCNQFDKVCTELGCAVIYCHHHSKGLQGQKRSMDRASGSGVFARDPDAMLDMIELEKTEALTRQAEDKAECRVRASWLERCGTDVANDLSQDDLLSASAMRDACERLSGATRMAVDADVEKAREDASKRTAWRVEGTLREFERFDPVCVWFDYPVHHPDDTGALSDVEAESEAPPWKRAVKAHKQGAEKKRRSSREAFDEALSLCAAGGEPTAKDLIEYFDGKKSEDTVYRWIKQFGYRIDKNTGVISRPDSD